MQNFIPASLSADQQKTRALNHKHTHVQDMVTTVESALCYARWVIKDLNGPCGDHLGRDCEAVVRDLEARATEWGRPSEDDRVFREPNCLGIVNVRYVTYDMEDPFGGKEVVLRHWPKISEFYETQTNVQYMTVWFEKAREQLYWHRRVEDLARDIIPFIRPYALRWCSNGFAGRLTLRNFPDGILRVSEAMSEEEVKNEEMWFHSAADERVLKQYVVKLLAYHLPGYVSWRGLKERTMARRRIGGDSLWADARKSRRAESSSVLRLTHKSKTRNSRRRLDSSAVRLGELSADAVILSLTRKDYREAVAIAGQVMKSATGRRSFREGLRPAKEGGENHRCIAMSTSVSNAELVQYMTRTFNTLVPESIESQGYVCAAGNEPLVGDNGEPAIDAYAAGWQEDMSGTTDQSGAELRAIDEPIAGPSRETEGRATEEGTSGNQKIVKTDEGLINEDACEEGRPDDLSELLSMGLRDAIALEAGAVRELPLMLDFDETAVPVEIVDMKWGGMAFD